MKKRLLLVGLLMAGLSVTAQDIFNYGFETPSSDLEVGKLEYINFKEGDTRDSISTMAHKGTYALQLNNALVAGNNWDRALKFRNLPIEPNTSYRVTFWVKGDATFTLPEASPANTNIRTRLMVGEENADVAYVAKGNATYDYTSTNLDPNVWKKMSMVFFYTNDAVQEAFYATTHTDTLKFNHYLSLNVYNPGTFYIDDVVVAKSSVKQITYKGDVIKVDLGYAINAADLRKGKDYETASLPVSSAKVMLGDQELAVEAVELQPDGFFIFLASDYLDDSAEGQLKVSFTNPTTEGEALLYNADRRPFSWDEASDKRVLDFADEFADYNVDLTGSSIIYYPPLLKTTLPENESFDLPQTTRTFAFTYNKLIDCASVKATLLGPVTGTGVVNGKLTLPLTETGFASTLTFTVPEGATMGDGDYTLTLTDVLSEQGIPADVNDAIVFTVGASTAAAIDTVMVPWTTENTGAETIPLDWQRVMSKKDGTKNIVRGTGTGSVGGARTKLFLDGGDFKVGYYHSARDFDTIRVMYGLYPENRLHLKAGRYSLSFYSAYWNTGAMDAKATFNLAITDTTRTKEIFVENGIASAFNCNDGSHGANDNSNVVVSGSAFHEYSVYIPEEGDYVMDFNAHQGWNSVVIANILMYSVPSSAVKYKSMLGTAMTLANNAMIAADSSMYDGAQKTALAALIEHYTNTLLTAPSDYVKGSADLTKGAEALQAHKTTVDNYVASVNLATTNKDKYTGTRFEALSAYPKLVTNFDLYKAVPYTDDAQLKLATDSLNHYANLLNNWATKGVPALTYRLNKAITLGKYLGVDSLVMEPARQALTDDDAIAEALNEKIKIKLYNELALDKIKFGSSWEDSTLVDSLELTNYIKNPNFYTAQTAQNLNNTTFPGWVTSGATNAGVGTLASATNPFVDTHASVFNLAINTFEQTVTNIPAGVYNVHMKTRTGDPAGNGVAREEILGKYYFYVIQGTDTIKTDFMITSWGLPATPTVIKNVTIVDGTITMGIHTGTVSGYTPSLFWGDPALWLVGKASGFPYTGLQQQEAVKGNVKEVLYYNIQGMRVARLVKGLNIVKTIYDNGTVDVQKIMMK